MSEFIRGSEWRRWDLHIHTPETQKNDNYAGSTPEEKWNQFYSTIDSYVGDGSDPTKNVVALGITDYLSIDNYKKVIADGRLPKSIKLVLPNVEMRIQPMAAESPVNIHFIFDPEIVSSLDSRFFGNLKFSYADTKISATKDELIRLGRLLDPDAGEKAAYSLGISQFVPSLDSIKEVFEDKELRNATIIGVSNNNSDGASGVTSLSSYCEQQGAPSQLTLFRQSIYQFVDFIFSAKPCDIQYFLGQKSDSEQTVITKCGSLKACLHGSDAHDLARVFEPNDRKYCWIKADPTFNGLRQVLYEPKARARISSLMPETKNDYHVIDHIEIDDPEFSKLPIYLNDKLTCIIGGKSTGKSTLLHNLALAIDRKQVNEKISTTKTSTKIVPNVKAYWLDGTVSTSGERDSTHKIVYIPQTYLNRLSDENEEVTEIDEIIQDIVLINDDAKTAFTVMQSSIQDYKPQLDKTIYDLIQSHTTILGIQASEKELGSGDGIQSEIKKLIQQKGILSKELSLSDEEVKSYDTAISVIRLSNESIEKLDKEIKTISEMDSVVTPLNLSYEFSKETADCISTAIQNAVAAAEASWQQSKTEILEKLMKKKDGLAKVLQKNITIRDGLHAKIAGNEAISKLSKSIQDEESKLSKFDELEKQKSVKVDAFLKLLDNVSSSFAFYKGMHETYASMINENPDLKCDDLVFSVTVPFRTDAFCKMIKSLFDNRTLRTRRDLIDVEEFNIDTFTSERLKNLIIACLNKEIPLVKSSSMENALRSILDDWYNTTYSVKMDNDPINKMSPGKKALVLLKLLIDLANSKCPILIDQPEDDLDNRSVFDDLIPFIREKKIDRQIIVVTHNANVVLGGDAEEIVVANQDGTNSPNRQFRFEYRSGSIEDDKPICNADGSVCEDVLSQQGIQQHICDILEGGEKAFDLRKNKYRI